MQVLLQVLDRYQFISFRYVFQDRFNLQNFFDFFFIKLQFCIVKIATFASGTRPQGPVPAVGSDSSDPPIFSELINLVLPVAEEIVVNCYFFSTFARSFTGLDMTGRTEKVL